MSSARPGGPGHPDWKLCADECPISEQQAAVSQDHWNVFQLMQPREYCLPFQTGPARFLASYATIYRDLR
jgi:sulfur relay (sulfurtransferase) DsrC/TusE family protein